MSTAVTPVSYSQYGEDTHILRVFGSEVGRFLDIGSWHPKQFSNSRALFEAGWSGVMIEPSPEPFLGLLKEYGNEPRVTLICAAIGFERNCLKLHATADAVSTTSEANYAMWKDHAAFTGTFYTPVLTLADLFNQFAGGYDFVNIDTEGNSVDLLNEMLKTAAYPKCICVEHDGRVVEVLQNSERFGYRAVHTNGTNVVLAR